MVIFLLNYLGCNFVIVESVESVPLIMVDFIAAKTAPQQLGPTAAVADVAVWNMFWTLVRAGAPPVSHTDPGNWHLHVAGCPGQVRVRQAAVSSISTVEAQLLGRLLQAALLHPCHFRVGGPLPQFHQSLPWSELMAIGHRIAVRLYQNVKVFN